MKKLCSKFLNLLRYISYIIDEKPKTQRFLRCFPIMFKEHIEYDNPKMLDKAMIKYLKLSIIDRNCVMCMIT